MELSATEVTKERTEPEENVVMDEIETNSCNFDAWTYNIMTNGTRTMVDLGVSVDNTKDPPEFVTGGVTSPISDPASVQTIIYWWPIPDDNPDHPEVYKWFYYTEYTYMDSATVDSTYEARYEAFISIENEIEYPTWIIEPDGISDEVEKVVWIWNGSDGDKFVKDGEDEDDRSYRSYDNTNQKFIISTDDVSLDGDSETWYFDIKVSHYGSTEVIESFEFIVDLICAV